MAVRSWIRNSESVSRETTMTGLQQLIAFLNERHVLSPDEVALLERRGLWTRTSAYADFEQADLPNEVADAATTGDWLYDVEVPVRPNKRCRRRRKRLGVAQTVTPDQPSQPR
jgi:hypothetical protein